MTPPCRPERSIIHTVDLKKRYKLGKDNFVDALRGASLDIMRGEMAAIMGPSGSGKSTFMHIAGCLDTPDSGEVWMDGRRIDELRGADLVRVRRESIGFIFQGFNLIPTLSAEENVALAAEYAGHSRREALVRGRELLELVGLGDRMRHVPSELSGGQQQRVAIARALVNDPVDRHGRRADRRPGHRDLGRDRRDDARRSTPSAARRSCIVTHNPEVAAACDRTIVMRDGVVVDSDSGGGSPA